MAADIRYPMWTVHLPQPSGSRPLRCTTDPQGPGGRASSYDDTGGSAARGGSIHTQFTNGIHRGSEIVFAGYKYRVQSATYGPHSVAYNHLGDIPGCSPESDSPKVPEPHGSIDIIVSNTGKIATSDESQVNITVATPTVRMSIPVYKRSDITKYLQGADSGYVPIYGNDLVKQDTESIQQLDNGKSSPVPVIELLTGIDRYVYYRDPDAGCVVAPTKGLAIGNGVSPPTFTSSRGNDSQSEIKRSAVSGDKSILILPNNGGTSRVMSTSNKPFTSDKSGTKESISPTTGIPVVVKDKNGKSVKVIAHSPSGDTDNPAHLQTHVMVVVKQVMVFVIVALAIFGIFVGLPTGSMHTDNSPFISSILAIGVAFVFSLTLSASSSVFGNAKVVAESSFPVVSTVVFAELLLGIILVIALILFPDVNTDTGDRISMIIFALLFLIAMMILTVGPYITLSDKSTYNATYQMYPMYYDRIMSILKYTMPFAVVLMFSAPMQNMFSSLFLNNVRGGTGLNPILNMVFKPDSLYGDVPTNPQPYRGSDQNLLEALVWFYDDSAPQKSPIDFAQYPVGYIQKSLTEIVPPKGASSDKYTGVVAAMNQKGDTVVVNTKSKIPQLISTLEDNRLPSGIDPKTLLKKGGSVLKNGYGDEWHIGISIILMIFFATVLMIPAFSGGIAFKTEQRIAEDKREKTKWGEYILDSVYGFAVPLIVLAGILYTYWGTGNNTQTMILSAGPIIALLVNGFAAASHK